MLRRLAIGFGLLLLVPLVGVPLWVALHRTDLPAPDDADLALEIPTVAESDNGWAHVLRAKEFSTFVSEDDERLRSLLSGAERDNRWLRRALRDNRPALAELERAIAAPEMVFPENPMGGHINELVDAQNLVRLANLESRTLRTGARLERTLLGLRLAEASLRARNPEMTVAMLASSLQRISLREARLALEHWTLDADASLRLSRELEGAQPSPEVWRRIWASEYRSQKVSLARMDESIRTQASNTFSLLPRDFVWQPNRTLALFADRSRSLARAFAEPCARGRSAFNPPEAGDRAKLLVETVHGNSIGVILNAIATPNFEKFNFRRCHSEARIALLEVEIALHAYGAAPDSLDALVPRYLDRVPLDPFDGEPLHYDRARGLVSSVGSDFAPTTVYGPPSPDDELEPAIYVPR